MIPNIGGPRQSRRLLLSQVSKSFHLYGSSIWEDMLRCCSKKDMMSIFRRGCLRICSGYRTISLEASCVVSGQIPIDLAAKEFHRIYERKRCNGGEQLSIIRQLERRQTINNWKARWENSSVGRWTYRLIPNIEGWLHRKHGEVNYNITQFLTGHGGYRSYLYRFGHDDSPNCPTCHNQEETAEHVAFVCQRFGEERRRLESNLCLSLSPENIIGVMIATEENWDRITRFLVYVNEELRTAEQQRKASRAIQ